MVNARFQRTVTSTAFQFQMGTITTHNRDFGISRTLPPTEEIADRPRENDILTRGFELAHFLLPNRMAALEVLRTALGKVEAKTFKDSKRAYWRDKFLKRQITRISQEDHDALQWLIYFESDSHERDQEARGSATVQDMAVRYLKTLVQISTGMSSFYVNVAIHRLLYSYSTGEAQAIHEAISTSYRDADEYRRAKRSLMRKIEGRFSGRLQLVKSEYGELRYELAENQDAFRQLIRECLHLFTPWSTWDKCPFTKCDSKCASRLDFGRRLEALGEGDRDKMEIIRCHVLLDPICQAQIAAALGLPAHQAKQAIPRFDMDKKTDIDEPTSRRPDGSLTREERQHVAEFLAAEQRRRKRIVARTLVARLDGADVGCLQVQEGDRIRFNIPADSALLELWTEDEEGPLLLATHLMKKRYSAGQIKVDVPVGRNRRACVQLSEPLAEAEGSCVIAVESATNSHSFRPLRRLRLSLAVGTYASVFLLAVALATIWYGNRPRIKGEQVPDSQITANHPPGISQNAGAVLTFHPTPDDLVTRGTDSGADRVLTLPTPPCIINVELVAQRSRSYRVMIVQLDSGKTILVSDLLAADQTGTVTVPISSALLVRGQYYRLRLQDNHRGDVTTFTFSTAGR